MDRRLMLGVAALVLLAGLVTVLAFSGDEVEERSLVYDVSWPVEPGPATQRSDSLQENRSDNYTFELTRSNVTQITVRLNWTDDVGDPDRFRLKVVPPDGPSLANESENGSIELSFDRAVPPQVGNVTAEDRSTARNQTLEESTSAGQGSWEVQVTLVEAPGRRPLPQAPQVETEPDGANDYNLTFAHEAFRAEIGEPSPPAPESSS